MRRTLWSRGLLALAAALVPFAAAGAQEASPTGLMLRVRSTVDHPGIGIGETLIHRDGLVIASGEREGRVTYLRGTADPALMAALVAALQDGRVGQQQADGCDAGGIPSAGPYATVVTWFGREGRRRRLLYGSAGIERCTDEVRSIARAVDDFLRVLEFPDAAVTAP